ncbi:MAG: ATP-binding cassette domain-containing protein [Candidatus Accumulibacter sp.]|nr:ATP-binding cassette domain-containing protein [Accumulibacter sp.]
MTRADTDRAPEFPSPPLLEFERVSFTYSDGQPGLSACSLTIREGSRNALIGANGAGKTTLFLHANGLFRPQAGCVRYSGQSVDYSRAGLRRLRSDVGLVFQNPDQQLFSASVFEDVSFGPLNLGLDPESVRERVEAALDAVRMSGFSDRLAHNLSFGQRKRICIAGVLAMRPRLLILDEPMAGLDHAMRKDLLSVLDGMHERGITLFLATHDIDFAYRWADRIHLMAAGCCVAAFDAGELSENATALQNAGLPLPDVVGLHRRLVEEGVTAGGDVPRSVRELLDSLTQRSIR